MDYAPHPVFGTQWGIFSTDTIPKDCLIGEYACDVLRGKDLILCKKMDTIMVLSNKNTPSDIYLAPKDYGGYVLLVNSGKHDNVNCKVQKIIVLNSLRILLITSRKIKKG